MYGYELTIGMNMRMGVYRDRDMFARDKEQMVR